MKCSIVLFIVVCSIMAEGCCDVPTPIEQVDYSSYKGKPVDSLLFAVGNKYSGFTILQEPVGTIAGAIFRFADGIDVWVYIDGYPILSDSLDVAKRKELYLKKIRSERIVGGQLYNYTKGEVVRIF